MNESEVPAAARYKEIVAAATTAAEKMREHEREKASRLAAELAGAEERIAEAEQQRDEVVRGVHKRWNMAMEALWDERWMQVTTMPDPDARAAPGAADELISQVQSAFLHLRKALEKPRWSPSLRRNRSAD